MYLMSLLLPLFSGLAHADLAIPTFLGGNLPASVDAFYQAPKGFEAEQPGVILRARNLTTVPYMVNATLAASYQLLFRSTDSQGNPNAVANTILIPVDAQTDKLLSFQFATDSPSVDCNPSYLLYTNQSDPIELRIVSQALQEGWHVVITDYEGPTAAYTNGIQSGQALLDSIRATLASSEFTGLDPSARYALTGASGGALASEWALELKQSYAPELDFAGALLTALTPNISSVYESVNGGPNAGLIPAALLGLAKQYLNLSSWIGEHLLSQYAPSFYTRSMVCFLDLPSAWNHTNFTSFFDVPDVPSAEIPASIFKAVGTMGVYGVPRAPLYIYKGIADEVSPISDSDELVAQYCAEGADIQYHRSAGVNHTSSSYYGFEVGWSWLADRLDGRPAAKGCETYNVSAPTVS